MIFRPRCESLTSRSRTRTYSAFALQTLVAPAPLVAANHASRVFVGTNWNRAARDLVPLMPMPKVILKKVSVGVE